MKGGSGVKMMIEGQRQRAGGGRRRRKKARPEPKAKVEPVLIVARRPDSPLLMKVSNRNIAASARPKKPKGEPISADANSANPSPAEANGAEMSGEGRVTESVDARSEDARSVDLNRASTQHSARDVSPSERDRRIARIVKAPTAIADDAQLRHERLLDRLVTSEGRSAISRIADELLRDERILPETQEVQLQLLEHVDERRARDAMDVMTRLLASQTPIKRPILDQRLRRLESEADEQETREKAARLRRSLRVA